MLDVSTNPFTNLHQMTQCFGFNQNNFLAIPCEMGNTVRPRDTRPQAARTSQVHVFELGPKKFEMNEFM